MRHCDILIPGHYFCDLIFSGIPGFPALGTELYTEKLTIVPGGCLNTITALQRLGVHVGWMGTLGSDPFSRVVDDWVAQEGIDRAWLTTRAEPFQRVTVALSYPADRAFVTYVDPPPDLLDGVRAAVAADECDHLHFAGLLVKPALPDLLDLCKTHKIPVSMDCQHRDDTLADSAGARDPFPAGYLHAQCERSPAARPRQQPSTMPPSACANWCRCW